MCLPAGKVHVSKSKSGINHELSVAYVHSDLTVQILPHFLQMVFDHLPLDSVFHLNYGATLL